MDPIVNNTPKSLSSTLIVLAVAIAALAIGYFIGLGQGKKSVEPAEAPNPFEKEAANPLEGVKNPFEDVKTNPFK